MDFPQDLGQLFFVAFCGVMTFMTTIFGFMAVSVRDDFREMSRNLHALTVNIASLTVKLDALDARLEKVERLRED